MNEDTVFELDLDDALLKRMRYRCHRGMLELDLILLPFFDKHYHDLTESDKNLFEQLLEEEDQQLQRYFMQQIAPPAELNDLVMHIISTNTST